MSSTKDREIKENEEEIRYIDLFGGVGGFRLGIERANNHLTLPKNRKSKGRGNREISKQETQLHNRSITSFRCVFYCDNDKYAVQTYNKNFGENWEAIDIRTIKTDSIPDFDFLCAGFPCQAFSIAGKRKGFEDTRGTMFYEIARILESKRPKYFLLENVKGLLSHDKGRTFAIILSTLTELGYDVQWMVLNSKFFGVPQNRERVFIIGSLRGTSRPEILPFRKSNRLSFEGREKRKNENRVASAITQNYKKGVHAGGENYIIHNIYKGFGEEKMRMFKEYFPTIRTPKEGGHLPMLKEDMKIRRLTPIECERLQGFPDNWTEGVSDTQRYKQMGNAVTVNVVKAIIEKMLK